MTKILPTTQPNIDLKVACFVLGASVLSSCNSFNATENQKEIIDRTYWQEFYNQNTAQNTVVVNQSLSNDSDNFTSSAVYDVSTESSDYTTTVDRVDSVPISSGGHTAGNTESALVSSVQTILHTNPTVDETSKTESDRIPSNNENTSQTVIASNGVAEIIAGIKPKVKPELIVSRPNVVPPVKDIQQTKSTDGTESTGNSVGHESNQQQDVSAKETVVANLGDENSNLDRVFRWPVNGRIIAEFGTKPDGEHNDGINLAVPEGTPVKSTESGTVIYSGNELKGYGNLLLIRHNDGWVSAYAHNKELKVKRGDIVQRGDIIANAGSTGSVKQPQLHFELRKGNKPVNPLNYLPQE